MPTTGGTGVPVSAADYLPVHWRQILARTRNANFRVYKIVAEMCGPKYMPLSCPEIAGSARRSGAGLCDSSRAAASLKRLWVMTAMSRMAASALFYENSIARRSLMVHGLALADKPVFLNEVAVLHALSLAHHWTVASTDEQMGEAR